MAKSRAESQRETRQRVLDAAHEAFSQRPIGAVSLDEIAAAAGYTKGAIYSNFSSKTDLLFAVVERRMRERGADYVEAVLGASDEALGEAVGDRAGRTQTNDLEYFRIVAALWAEAVHDPSIATRYAELRRRHRARLADAIQTRADGLGLTLRHDPADLATAAIGVSMATMLEACIDDEIDVNRVHRTFSEVVLAGVLATSA